MSKTEARVWTIKRPTHFTPWHVSQMEVTEGPIIERDKDSPFELVEVKVIEYSAYLKLQEELAEAKRVIELCLTQTELFNFAKDEKRVYHVDTMLREFLTKYPKEILEGEK